MRRQTPRQRTACTLEWKQLYCDKDGRGRDAVQITHGTLQTTRHRHGIDTVQVHVAEDFWVWPSGLLLFVSGPQRTSTLDSHRTDQENFILFWGIGLKLCISLLYRTLQQMTLFF